MGATLEELFDALGQLGEDGPLQATSLRLPKALHDALSIATELGMDSSVSAATREALAERICGFARQAAFTAHLAAFPDDMPRLAQVAKRRVSGTDHPAAAEPGLIDEVAAEIERREPTWALTALDDTVDDVLAYVELLAAGVGRRSA
ncbi:MAG: hypothetical protein ACRDV4_04495 [Acidimicrobiales bacterium]